MRIFTLLSYLFFCALCCACSSHSGVAERPNIIWINAEDISPALDCYGDAYTTTPHMDQLAQKGILYRHAFVTVPMCAPSRSCLVTGIYATSLGPRHLRSETPRAAAMMIRSENSTPYEMAQDTAQYDLPRILEAAEMVGTATASELAEKLNDPDSGMRFWVAIRLQALGKEVILQEEKALDDSSLTLTNTYENDQNRFYRCRRHFFITCRSRPAMPRS